MGLHPVGALSVPPLVLVSFDLVRPDRVTKFRFSDHSRLPAVNYGLGDYTQWVH